LNRQRLVKLFAALGSDNANEAASACGMIHGLLDEHGKQWADLVELLGGNPASLKPDLVRDVNSLGSVDPDESASARQTFLNYSTAIERVGTILPMCCAGPRRLGHPIRQITIRSAWMISLV
jgi:hypothetical protein